jgi:hypothetical protein
MFEARQPMFGFMGRSWELGETVEISMEIALSDRQLKYFNPLDDDAKKIKAIWSERYEGVKATTQQPANRRGKKDVADKKTVTDDQSKIDDDSENTNANTADETTGDLTDPKANATGYVNPLLAMVNAVNAVTD